MICRAALGYEVAHELAHDLGGRPIVCLTGVDEGAPQPFIDPYLKRNILPRHSKSVPIVHPFENPKACSMEVSASRDVPYITRVARNGRPQQRAAPVRGGHERSGANGVDYIFGLAGNSVFPRLSYEVADDLKVRRAEAGADRMRGFAAFPYAAGSWGRERRVVARLEATARGFDARYIVTSLGGEPQHLYEGIYCARGQAENLIKLHKGQLASDRTSCQSPIANQFRLVVASNENIRRCPLNRSPLT